MSPSDARAVPNAVSFDLEHWHSATLLSDAVENPDDRIEASTEIVLDLLERNGVRATFFVVGRVAEERPDLIARVADAGHEVASHGHTHTPLYDLSPAEFELELERAAAAISEAIGRAPEGFRAPNFSVTPETAWAPSVLESNGYRYDSSVFPVPTPMYGVADAPVRPYRVSASNPFRAAADGDGLFELPLSVADPRLRLPIAGGFYGRLLPGWLIDRSIRRLRRQGVPANLYFHPWEFNPEVPVESPPLHRRFVSFHGIDRIASKLDRLLSAFEWGPVHELVDRLERLEESASEPCAGRGAPTDHKR